MSRKADMRAALEHRQPDGTVPIWELSFHLWHALSGGKVVVGTAFAQLTADEQERALHTNAEAMCAVAHEMGFAAVTVPGDYWEVAPGAPSYYWLPAEARIRQAELLVRALGDEVLLVADAGGVLGMPGPWNYVEFCCRLLDAPEKVDEDARQCLKTGLESARRYRDIGIEGLCSPSDIADNRGPFFSPAQLDRFIFPYLREWAAAIHALEAYSILHTDGNLYPCLEEIADSGISALQAIDPVAGMDIARVKAQVGDRLCLCGNVDCGLLLTGCPETVYSATRDLILACKSGGGFVLGASNAVQQEVPPENYRALVHAWKDYGQYRRP